MYRYLVLIFVLAVGITFQSCDSTSSGGNDLESLITNSKWYTTSGESSGDFYFEYDFGDSQVMWTFYSFPCGEGDTFGSDTAEYEVIDDETISIDGDEGTVLDYSEDQINIEATNDSGETETFSLYSTCEQLSSQN